MAEGPRRGRLLLLLCLALSPAGCGDGATGPSGPDLTGTWKGEAEVGFGLPTPLQMTLVDTAGSLSGQGGGVDCRFFQHCGSFGTYTVTGSHDRSSVSLRGTSSTTGRAWTLTGTLSSDGQAMSGVATGEFPTGPWQMTRSR